MHCKQFYRPAKGLFHAVGIRSQTLPVPFIRPFECVERFRNLKFIYSVHRNFVGFHFL